MKKLHIENQIFEPKEGQRISMCSNIEENRCPSLSIKSPNLMSEEEALEYFANILAQAYLDHFYNEKHKPNQSK